MTFKSALLTAAAVLLVAGPARADVAPDVQKTLTDAYQLTCTAVLDPTDANVDAAFAVLSPDFVNIDFKGKQTSRDEVVAQAKQQLKTFHGTKCENKSESMTQSDPNTIVVVETGVIEGDIQAPDGKHELSSTQKSQDTWKLVNGKWMQTQSKDLRALVKVDGNVVQDQGQ